MPRPMTKAATNRRGATTTYPGTVRCNSTGTSWSTKYFGATLHSTSSRTYYQPYWKQCVPVPKLLEAPSSSRSARQRAGTIGGSANGTHRYESYTATQRGSNYLLSPHQAADDRLHPRRSQSSSQEWVSPPKTYQTRNKELHTHHHRTRPQPPQSRRRKDDGCKAR